MKTQLLTINRFLLKAVFLLTLIFSIGCSKDESITDPEKKTETQSINSYIKALSYNADEILGVEDTDGEAIKKTAGVSEEKDVDLYGDNATTACTTTNYNLKTNFESIAILKPQEGVVYPGALVVGDGNMTRGIPDPLSIDRGPMTIRVDLPGIGEAGNQFIEDPSFTTVDAGIDKALEWWNANAYQDGYVNPASQYSEAKTSHSSKQASIELGLNVSWASNEMAAQFNYETTTKKRVAMMSFKQVFYTVTMDLPNNPSEVFDETVTLSKIESTVNSEIPPAFVHSVSYGRIIMFRMESNYEMSETEFKGSFEYAAGKRDASGDTEINYKEILENSSITTVVLGGNAKVGAEAVSAKNFGDLEKIIKGDNAVYSRDNPGVPISYTIRYLRDNKLAKMGTSTDYQVVNCVTSGTAHNEISFYNRLADNFRIGIQYKTNMPGQNEVLYEDIDWKHNKVDGATTTITPPNGAHTIFYHVERDKFGGNVDGFERKLKRSMGNWVHTKGTKYQEECWESYRTILGSAEVRYCK